MSGWSTGYRLKKATCMIKVLEFLSNTTLTNSFLLMSSTYLVINRALVVV